MSNNLFGAAGGGTGGGAPDGGLFEAPAGGLFSAAQKPPATSSFGQPAPAQPSAPSGGLFNAQKPSTLGLFGQPGGQGAPQPAPTPAPAPTGGLFGAASTQPAAQAKPQPAPGASSANFFGAPAQPAKPATDSRSLFTGVAASQPAPSANSLNLSSAQPQKANTLGFGQQPAPSTQAVKQPVADPKSATQSLFDQKTPDGGSSGGFLKPPQAADASGSKPAASSGGINGLNLSGGPTRDKQEDLAGGQPTKKPALFGADASKGKEEAKAASPFGAATASTAATAAVGADKNAAAAQQVTEAQKIQNEKAAQDAAFKAKPLQYVTKGWQEQVRRNEKQFNDAVENLREYEVLLVNSLAQIEKIETQSVQVKDTYKENMSELQDVSLQQNALIGELSAIEDELDSMLPQFMGTTGTTENRFLKQVIRNPGLYETGSSREQVFQKALDLDCNIQELDQNLQTVQGQMQQSEKNHAHAADLYVFGGDAAKKQQVADMERTLENFYSCLKWVENATADLQFQVDDIQKKVDGQSNSQSMLYSR